jgi:hypothetical protein
VHPCSRPVCPVFPDPARTQRPKAHKSHHQTNTSNLVLNNLQIHLVLDTSLAGEHVDVRAYASRALSLGDKALATEFVELPCEVLMGEAERVGRERPGGSAGGPSLLKCGLRKTAAGARQLSA